jgi:hypothetical protein
MNLTRVKNKLDVKFNQLDDISNKINGTIKKALDVINKKEINSEDGIQDSEF